MGIGKRCLEIIDTVAVSARLYVNWDSKFLALNWIQRIFGNWPFPVLFQGTWLAPRHYYSGFRALFHSRPGEGRN